MMQLPKTRRAEAAQTVHEALGQNHVAAHYPRLKAITQAIVGLTAEIAEGGNKAVVRAGLNAKPEAVLGGLAVLAGLSTPDITPGREAYPLWIGDQFAARLVRTGKGLNVQEGSEGAPATPGFRFEDKTGPLSGVPDESLLLSTMLVLAQRADVIEAQRDAARIAAERAGIYSGAVA